MDLDQTAREPADVVRSVGHELDVGSYSVIGSYGRFSFETRSLMGVWWEAIYAALTAPSSQRHNYLLWGKPGEGKTRFVTEAAKNLRDRLEEFCFLSFNCAKDSAELFEDLRLQLREGPLVPTLCFFDEVDDPAATVFYGRMLELLELNERPDRHVAYVLAGSGYGSLEGMIEELRSREKGTDAVSRVPAGNRVTVPAMDLGDRLLVFVSVAMAAKVGEPISSLERFGLYQVLSRPELDTPREVVIVAQQAAARMRPTETVLRYGHLFDAAEEARRFNFRRDHEEAATSLSGAITIRVAAAAPKERAVQREVALSNLPPSPSRSLIGRDEEVAALVDAVRSDRLVTITGPGGVGKTRLMIELGHRLFPEFPGGTAYVEVADVTDGENFLPTLAERLDVKEAEGRSFAAGITTLIGSQRALLLIDNFEQLLGAARDVAHLVAACPQLHVVVTSRTQLRLAEEREFRISPLALPVTEDDPIDRIRESPAVSLFLDRAVTPKGQLVLTEDNAHSVAAICRRLDGLPLALELGAARLKLLTPQLLLERLASALDVLTSGPRDLPERQQTLRAAVDWSHSLLDDEEKKLFRRMSVFSGGCTLEQLESVCTDQDSCLDLLESLVDKALVQVSETGRFTMLRTISEYASERLAESAEQEEIIACHAAAFVAVAHEIRDGIERDHQVASVERGIVEDQNLSVALDTLLAGARAGDVAAADAGLRTCGNLNLYWHIRGKNLTARETSNAFLEASKGLASESATAAAMRTAGLGAWALGQIELANQEWEAATDLARSADDPLELCLCRMFAVFGLIGVDGELGRRCATDALELARSIDYPWAEGLALIGAGFLSHVDGELDEAKRLLGEALSVCEGIGDYEGMGLALGGLAALAVDNDTAQALDLYERSLKSFESIGDRAEEARVLSEMALAYLDIGDGMSARQRLYGAVRAYLEIGSVRGVGLAILGLAAVASFDQHHEVAATIAAAGERYIQQQGVVNVYTEGAPGLELVNQSRALLDATTLESASVRGSLLSIDEAVALSHPEQRVPG